MSSHLIQSESIQENKVIPNSFFCRPAEEVAPDLIGCELVKRQENGNILSGVIVETEAYSQVESACHGSTRRSKSNETLFGPPGHFYIYLTYGIYHCVNVVTDRDNWASGVLLRALALPGEDERIASGPGLLAQRFGLNRTHDNLPISIENGLWMTNRTFSPAMQKIIRTKRVGISQEKDLPWRWYLQSSRSVSKRAKGDRCPKTSVAWTPSQTDSR